MAAAAQTYLTTALPGTTKPAIVFDIDNTVLETNYHPGPIIPAIPPILKLAQWAKSQGASLIFVTGRPALMNVYSQINLSTVGYPVDGLYGGGLTTGSSGAGALADYKTATRASIEAQGYTIVANIGNSASDLSGGHAQQTFKLPDYNGALA
ncbi:phosphatase [Nocardia sp. CT2-14]|uniref:Phosphatase n=1 Tax=Nocardia aurantiaca TaxID=2675850 RepID=A0A6I3KZG5_9NOCA|nr:phosphatase [Nocardia aurantiaca]